eukprot:2094742-Lingulodinium_polyedra.AAC.1
MGREAKFAKQVAPAHLSSRQDFLSRAPESKTRKFAVAFLASGLGPTAEEIRRTGIPQLPDLNS